MPFCTIRTTAEIYAHASAGCLHFRPLLNLALERDFENASIAEQAVEMTSAAVQSVENMAMAWRQCGLENVRRSDY
jgi:hypothetical protein